MMFDRIGFVKSMLVVAVVSAFCFAAYAAPQKKLNFVFCIVDDLGWKDISCMGSDFYETPAIDRLAKDGVLFTDAYQAAPRCVSSRTSIMTGKYHYRPGIKSGDGIALEEVTIAEAFKEAGYRTFFTGKWHLGKKGYYPQDQGFDINKGGCEYGAPPTYFHPYSKPGQATPPGLEGGKEGQYLTDRLTDESIGFLRDHVKEHPDKPFLLWLSHYGVHTPLEAKEELIKKYEKKLAGMPRDTGPDHITDYTGKVKMKQDLAVYAAMIESVDESVKRIRKELERSGLADNTAIIFTSDNGGLSTTAATSNRPVATSNHPLRTGKGWIYEGGIRLPLIVFWPGVTKAGSVSSLPVVGTDLYPTMLDIADLSPKPKQHIDGVSFAPMLKGDKSFKRGPIYWYYTFAKDGTGNPSMAAVRDGDYKLVEILFENKAELYDLSNDVGEQIDLASREPERTKKMRSMLQDWAKETEAPSLWKNKNFVETNKALLEAIKNKR